MSRHENAFVANLLLKWLRSLLSLSRPRTIAPDTWARTLLTWLDNWNKVIWHMGTTPRPHSWNKLLLETVPRLQKSKGRNMISIYKAVTFSISI